MGIRTTILPRAFYDRPTLDVARDLIGKVLVHAAPAGRTAGRIVEVEAYIGESDPACHAAPGPTPRNRVMYGSPGVAYVYFNYGMHCLVNVVTEEEGAPAAVLIRALEPLQGMALMRRRRARRRRGTGMLADHDLCRGPGNLCRAMGITLRQNRLDLCGGRLFIEDAGAAPRALAWSRRIGIRVGVEQEWRCIDADSAAVSGRSRRLIP
jgi:DNA-3-methyladenine glycosylase